jgi:hypothetical protein
MFPLNLFLIERDIWEKEDQRKMVNEKVFIKKNSENSLRLEIMLDRWEKNIFTVV